jgi:hypothetical protein
MSKAFLACVGLQLMMVAGGFCAVLRRGCLKGGRGRKGERWEGGRQRRGERG